jgi:Phage portal protein
MSRFFNRIIDSVSRKDIIPVNSYEGFPAGGQIVLRDRRGTVRAEVPHATEKSADMGSDPLTIYEPTGAEAVDAAKALASFTG